MWPSGSLVVVVGAGGVGKTTVAAALGLAAAHEGRKTLVMTFDPSRRLKDALGVGAAPADQYVPVPNAAGLPLWASLLDAKATFDRLVRRHAADESVAQRILQNRFYSHLSGTLAGVLEYMAVERLFEVAGDGQFDRIVLDTPPTRQALDFLGAPARITGFLDSGALRIALKPWFDEAGHLKATRRFGLLGRGVEAWFDRNIGLRLLRDLAEFFVAFSPLYEGFHERAAAVDRLLRSPETEFVLVTRPEAERVPETLFFARRLVEQGHHLGPMVVNMRHPVLDDEGGDGGMPADAARLMRWLGDRDRRGIDTFRQRMPGQPLIELPLLPDEPGAVEGLERLRLLLVEQLNAV